MAKDVIGKISKQFKMADFCADKAYNSREMFKFIQDLGMNPYIPFKKNHTGKAKGVLIWKVMFEKFIRHNQDFKKHYHQRSNVETNFSMLKERFGKSCRCKTLTGQTNEIKCKMLAVNICLLIQLAYEYNVGLDLASCVKTNAFV